MLRQARKVAARYAQTRSTQGWVPPIPRTFLERLVQKLAYSPDTKNVELLDLARDSVGVFLPKILDLLRKKQKERYYLNVSESQGRFFYFMIPRQKVDAFNMTLAMHGPKTHISFGFTPYKLDGTPDFKGMLTKQTLVDPELAGMMMMRLVRATLAEIK